MDVRFDYGLTYISSVQWHVLIFFIVNSDEDKEEIIESVTHAPHGRRSRFSSGGRFSDCNVPPLVVANYSGFDSDPDNKEDMHAPQRTDSFVDRYNHYISAASLLFSQVSFLIYHICYYTYSSKELISVAVMTSTMSCAKIAQICVILLSVLLILEQT